MNFIIECLRILGVISGTIMFSAYTHLVLTLWQELPIEEEPSTPIYITKVIKDGR